MTQEEKAKAYDEAIEYGRYLINERCKEGTNGSFHRVDLQKMFPELKESEDERIRNFLMMIIDKYAGVSNEEKKKCLAWLEKQGEQEPVNEHKFNKGITVNDAAFIHLSSCITPATKEQRELLFQKMKEAGYEWDADKKELKKIEDEPKNYKQQIMSEMADLVKDYIEQKPAWSEEDCNQIETIACHLDNIGNGAMAELLLNIMNKYKSLRPQNTWKPSLSQLNALGVVVKGNAPDDIEEIKSLYNDLKKL